MAFEFGIMDPITGYLEKNKERLGPLHRPLHVLSGAVAFVMIFAAILFLPAAFLNSSTHVVVAQIALVVIYFFLFQALQQNVFDRFVFCLILFVVLTAAPNAVGVEVALADYSPPSKMPDLAFIDVFIYAVLRGLPCTLWSAPLLLFFFTFAPRLNRQVGGLEPSLKLAVWLGLGLHLVAVSLTFWLAGMWPRFTASTGGAIKEVAHDIVKYQYGFFIFSCLYLAVGFAALLLIRFRIGGQPPWVLLTVVVGLFAGQVLFAVMDYNVRALNACYPAALTTGSAVKAYANVDKTDFAFENTWYRQVSRGSTSGLVLYTGCAQRDLGRFTRLIADEIQFRERFPHQVDLGILAERHPAGRFCQSNGTQVAAEQ